MCFKEEEVMLPYAQCNYILLLLPQCQFKESMALLYSDYLKLLLNN